MNDKWGYIDTSGRFIIKPQYVWADSFSDGRATVDDGDGQGYIDTTGKVAIEPRFKSARRFAEGLAPVALLDPKTANTDDPSWLWGYIGTTGAMVIEPQFEDANPFSDGRAAVMVNHRWGYIDTAGAFMVKPELDHAEDFSDGLAYVVQADGYSGYIDTSGRLLITMKLGAEVQEARPFSEGRAVIGLLTTQPGEANVPPLLYGYMDKSGKIIIKPQFPLAEDFLYGLARVRLGAPPKYSYIDASGRIVWTDK